MRERSFRRGGADRDNEMSVEEFHPIRKAIREDAQGIFRVERHSFANVAERFHLDQVKRLIVSPNAETFVVEGLDGGLGWSIWGWAAGLVRRTGKTLTGRVYAVAVLPDARGFGLGRRLTEQVLAALRSRGAGRIFLEVRADNKRAIGLYRKLGFRKRHMVRDYYGSGLHALSMVLEDRS